jgi:hypothetical protein
MSTMALQTDNPRYTKRGYSMPVTRITYAAGVGAAGGGVGG